MRKMVEQMINSSKIHELITYSAKADDEYGGRLPVHVRCLLDELRYDL